MKTFFGRYKRLLKMVFFLLIGIVASIIVSNLWINNATKNLIYGNVADIPARKVGLVLGASRLTKTGAPNLYFKYRIEAAYLLYKNHKIKFLLLSGDNHVKGYDEPADMKEALIALGVPDSCLFLDYAGFRTLDSVVRCEEVFGEDSVIIISQKFHNQRALFIADKNNLNAIGFNAKEVNKKHSLKTRFRECFARVKCVLDIYILNTAPKFLGKKIMIG